MPIYEYECPKCGVVEVTQRITEDPLKRCPKCKRCKVKKLISNTSFQLKGSGWYVTDYGGKKTDGDSKSSDSAASSSTKTESKSDSGTKSDSSSKKKDGKKAKAA